MKQFTATVYILQDDKVLLIYHKKHRKWLPPGGHLEADELPTVAAIREAKEETGLDIEIIPQENVWIPKRENAESFERPYLCLLEHVPARKDEKAHQHIDLIYLGRPIGGILQNNHETEGIHWFSWEEIEKLEKDVEIFEDTYCIIQHLMHDRVAPSDQVYAQA